MIKYYFRGPFTERQVQEWYREKHFDSAFAFCVSSRFIYVSYNFERILIFNSQIVLSYEFFFLFLAEGEAPSDSTEFVTLGEFHSDKYTGTTGNQKINKFSRYPLRAQR